ncbi:hypothetical protein [Methylobacterium gnaphalii]|nr:hypothetical protein [Methylobacterium gnaphalii]GJD67346.1 hypothetical protein MMMDOFMJ_0261 [Methylobacterium gnaphalii]
MTVNIDPSEVRARTSAMPVAAKARRRLPLRAMLIGGLGGAGLIAFTVGAFSFFSTLADPRIRISRPMPVAALMPDLKDGLPELVEGPVQKSATFNLPRPETAEPAPAQPAPVEQAATPPAAEPAPVEHAAFDPQAPALRSGTTPPPIQNAPTVPATRTVAVVAPPARPAATIPPARTETVKAKPVQANAVAAVAPSREAEPLVEPASTATVSSPAAVQPPRKPVAAKPAVQKTAARKTPAAKTVADAEPAAAGTPAATASDDSDIPGAQQLRAGVKAITGLFGGDKDE